MENDINTLTYTEEDGFVRRMLFKKPQANGFLFIICAPCKRPTNSKKIDRTIEQFVQIHLESKAHKDKVKQLLDMSMMRAANNFARPHTNALCTNVARAVGYDYPRPDFSMLLYKLRAQRLNFLGLEYVVEFYCNNYTYNCYLCSGRFVEGGILEHLDSGNHHLNYLNIHFPSISGYIDHMEQREKQINSLFQWHKLKLELVKIASQAVQNECGQMLPKSLSLSIETANHNEISRWVTSEPHFDESKYPQLMDVINEEVVKNVVLDNLFSMFPVLKHRQVDEYSMSVAINISKELLCSGGDPTPEKLSKLVHNYVNAMKPGDNAFGHSTNEAESNPDDYNYPVLIENFNSLNFEHQVSLKSHLKTLYKFDPTKLEALRRDLSVAGAQNLMFILN